MQTTIMHKIGETILSPYGKIISDGPHGSAPPYLIWNFVLRRISPQNFERWGAWKETGLQNA